MTYKGGAVEFRLKEVQARKEGYATYVLTVEDTGIGMSEEFQESLFEPFARENNSTVSRIQGTGLGMTIVKELVDLLDGKIEINTGAFKSLKVLLVEDNELNREIAIDMLEDEGFIVESAEDGSVAVETLSEKGPDYYDFVLMDIQMPFMNGYDATKAIRKMYPEAKLPIIALSANAFAEDKKKSIDAGMDDHVAKPINIKELFGVLANYL